MHIIDLLNYNGCLTRCLFEAQHNEVAFNKSIMAFFKCLTVDIRQNKLTVLGC
jgi:hypothetical protein